MRLSLVVTTASDADNEAPNAEFMNPHSDSGSLCNWSINPPPPWPANSQTLYLGKLGLIASHLHLTSCAWIIVVIIVSFIAAEQKKA